MRLFFAIARLLAAVAVIAAVVAQWESSVKSPDYFFFNFFGYFTIQSNLLIAATLVLAAAYGFRRLGQPGWLIALRGATVTYMATTGVVYNTILVNGPLNDFTVQWSNDILHKWIPLFAILDWVLFGDRSVIPWKRLWLFLIYPLVWLGATLLRGQDFVPYPFLNVVKLGGGVVALYCIGIAVFIAGMSALVIFLSRYRLLRPGDGIVDGAYERARISST